MLGRPPGCGNAIRASTVSKISEGIHSRYTQHRCEFEANFDDVSLFIEAVGCNNDPNCWSASHPDCPFWNADVNGDGDVDYDDISPFVDLLGGNAAADAWCRAPTADTGSAASKPRPTRGSAATKARPTRGSAATKARPTRGSAGTKARPTRGSAATKARPTRGSAATRWAARRALAGAARSDCRVRSPALPWQWLARGVVILLRPLPERESARTIPDPSLRERGLVTLPQPLPEREGVN
jgi:hypothetical protein